MMRTRFLILVAFLLVAFLYGCSGGGIENPTVQNPTAPVSEPKAPAADGSGTMACLGFYQVTVDTNAGTIQAVDMRSSELIMNVLGFLEPPPLGNMTIDFVTLVLDPTNNLIKVDVILKHPIPDPVFTGFDVRGVVFGPEVTNADGLTVIPGPEFFAGVPFGYQEGLLGAPDSVGHYTGLAGYKYYCDGLAKTAVLSTFMSNESNLTNRGRFSASSTWKRHYDLDWTNVSQAFFVFNYAIYANYNWPVGSPPIQLEDFPDNANAAEAFCGKITGMDSKLWYASGDSGGTVSFDIEVWDWAGDINNVTVYSKDSGVIAETPYTSTTAGSTTKSTKYSFVNVPGLPTRAGDITLYVKAEDSKTFGDCWFMGLLPSSNSLYTKKIYNCFSATATVAECPRPVITAMNPNTGWGSQSLACLINCTFQAGPQLGAKLVKSGQPDTIGTVTASDPVAGTINVTFVVPSVSGAWDLVVINGCGTPSLPFANALTVKSCGAMNLPGDVGNNGYWYGYKYTNPWDYGYHQCGQWGYGDWVSTTKSATPYLIGFDYYYNYYNYNAMYTFAAWRADFGSSVPDYYFNTGYWYWPIYMWTIDSNDRVYYCPGWDPYAIYYTDFDPSTGGFGPATYWQYTGYYCSTQTRMCVDENDNLIIVYDVYPDAYIYHWNGGGWDVTVAPAQLATDHNNQGYWCTYADIAWEPVLDNLLVVDREYWDGSAYKAPSRCYAIKLNPGGTGTVSWEINPVWTDWYTAPGNSSYMGIYVNQQDPECHILISGGTYHNTGYNQWGFARCNPAGGELTATKWDITWWPDWQYWEQARGTVQTVWGSWYYYDFCSYPYVGSSEIVGW